MIIYHVTDITNNIHCGDSDSLREAIEIAMESSCDGEFRVEVYHYKMTDSGKTKIITDWTNY